MAFGQRTITMRLGETYPADYPTPKGDYEFSRLVKERSGGRALTSRSITASGWRGRDRKTRILS
jgi:hypothetical protein